MNSFNSYINRIDIIKMLICLAFAVEKGILPIQKNSHEKNNNLTTYSVSCVL